MKSIEEVRKICGHYLHKPEYPKLLGEHRCCKDFTGRCPDLFEYCPLYELVKRDKKKEEII